MNFNALNFIWKYEKYNWSIKKINNMEVFAISRNRKQNLCCNFYYKMLFYQYGNIQYAFYNKRGN